MQRSADSRDSIRMRSYVGKKTKRLIERTLWISSVPDVTSSQALHLSRGFSGSRLPPRILERLEDEGWDTELHEYPRFYDGLKDQPGVKVSKALTDKGTFASLRVAPLRFMHYM